jgi:hypothetical protein
LNELFIQKQAEAMSEEKWNLKTTEFGKFTLNPLRLLWERSQPPANPEKSVIILQAGEF